MKKALLTTLLFSGATIAAPFVVKDIRVDGVAADTQSSIISSLPIRVGQTATDNDVANVVRQLFSQDRYANVSAMREGNTLVIKILPRATLGMVKVEGNKAIPKEPLDENLKANQITTGENYNAEKIEAFRQGLLEHYHSTGRYNAEIETITTPLDNGQVDVTYKITENDVSEVKSIQFEGNNSFASDVLLKQLEIQPDVPWWNIFSSSKYEQQTYSKDLEALRDYYLNRGYAKYQLKDVKVEFSEDKKDVNLTYIIDEGAQYNISEIRIIGDTAGMDSELNDVLKDFQPGQQFHGTELRNMEEQIKNKLGERGFGAAKVELFPTFDDANKTVRMNLIVDAGKRLYVRKIRFEGNDVTADSTLRREMRQQEGAWLSTSLLELSKARLERTGFYETVEMTTPAVSGTDDQVDVVYKIKERNTGSINFGIGYGTESGVSYQAGIKQDNFLGMGSSLSLSGSRNDYGTSVSLGYTEPYFTKDGVSLGGNVFYETYDNSKSSSSSPYKRTTYGVNGTLGFPVDENNSYYLGLGYAHDTVKNLRREYSRELYMNSMGFSVDDNSTNNDLYTKLRTNDFDFSFGWNYNSLDRGFLPTEGTSANIGGKITIPGSDNKYYKVSAGFNNFIPLNRDHRWVLSTKANIAYASGYGGKQLPFFQNYAAGGIGSLRGFASWGVGPHAIYRDTTTGAFTNYSDDVIGGNAMTTASMELIFPTPFVSDKYQHNVRTSLFVDAASVWNSKWKKDVYPSQPDYSDWKKFRASTGVAFQWNSPIGPLVFSYAKPIRKYDGDEIEQFQFSIGGTF